MLNIGVLALQGSVIEHINALNKIPEVNAIEVKKTGQLDNIDGLILPGGESTTISKLLHIFGLFEPLKNKIQNGMPVWGTCAGMILLANKIIGETEHLGVMDITVRRNAYGRQLDSFNCSAHIPEFGDKKIPLIFIRAPWIEEVGAKAMAVHIHNSHIIAAKQNNMLVTAFHPELTDDLTVHKYFTDMCKK
ncbi:MAG: pyridoxal 5-phosphate synthase, glutaminase subunit Pdx2 [Clostridia bacterium]|nr:pyridoxal 5-phosphate synthase, glutaminase subunit Pdx2 [Clostridia bacterium]